MNRIGVRNCRLQIVSSASGDSGKSAKNWSRRPAETGRRSGHVSASQPSGCRMILKVNQRNVPLCLCSGRQKGLINCLYRYVLTRGTDLFIVYCRGIL